MANLNVERDQLFDPALLIQQLPYINNGLTYVSDNTSIHPRDEAGNIILQENSETNPLLIIEPTQVNYTVATTNRVLDTTFRYFKFPVAASVDVPDINIDDLQLDVSTLEFDGAYARYKPSTDFTPAPSSGTYSGILMDQVVEGLQQENTNCYTITKELKNSGSDLRFRIKISHKFSSSTESIGSIFWSLMKTGPNYPAGGGIDRSWKTGYASSRTESTNFTQLILSFAEAMRNICQSPAGLGESGGFEEPWITYYRLFITTNIEPNQSRLTGAQLEAYDYVITRDPSKVRKLSSSEYTTLLALVQTTYNAYKTAVDNSANIYGTINANTTQTVYIDEYIKNSDFEIGDIIQIGVLTNNEGHTILNNQSYWVITDASKNVDLWNQEKVV